MLERLPVDERIPEIREAVDRRRAAVVVAEPGAGKTTRIPPALLDAGPCAVLQPRRAAARAVARRIADERGWTVGREVGWHVRFERNVSRDTRLVIATEGVLTARLVADPLLAGIATVVLDEFHERSVHADLAIAMVREAMRARDDLRVVVLSATLDAGAVADHLDGCPVIEVSGRPHDVAVEYAPGVGVADAVRRMLAAGDGDVLAFLPGVREIERVRRDLADAASAGVAVLPLHGAQDAAEQDAALAPRDGRKVVLATNLAETSLTVPGVTAVVDGGLHRVMRYDPERGIDRLETERIPHDAATQRAGRAGRIGPGRVLRLWDPREDRPLRREPDVRRIDLVPVVLDVFAWGARPETFGWFERPPEERIEAAVRLLRDLGAIDPHGVSPRGERLRRLPLHPRLARLVEADGGSDRACAAAAWIGESRRLAGDGRATSSDLLSLADRIDRAPAAVRRAVRQIRSRAREVGGASPAKDEASFLRAVLAAWPDRVGRRREPGSRRVLLSNGTGAVVDDASGVRDGDFLVAVDLAVGRRGARSEAIVRLASRVEGAWLRPDRVETEHRFDESAGRVRAARVERLGAIVLRESDAEPDPERAAALLADRLASIPLDPADETTLRRLRFAGIDVDVDALRREACRGRVDLPAFRLADALDPATRARLARLAPAFVPVPSGREARLTYRDDGEVVLSVRLQELFGMRDAPRIGPDRAPVLVELLAPNGRPVQTTRDLAGFWERGYGEVRRELRGRYPRHPWPEDPTTAVPTARAKPRRRRS